MEITKVTAETPQHRYVRIRQEFTQLSRMITFNVTTFRGRSLFKTKQRIGYDEFECSHTKIQDLFTCLFSEYPEYFDDVKHIKDSVVNPSDHPTRDFVMISDANPKQGQEPFIFVELLHVNNPHPDPNKRGKYFKDLHDFLGAFLNVSTSA